LEVEVYIYLLLLIALIGAFAYYAAGNPKTQELGRIMFAVGLLAFLLKWAGEVIGK
jgi:hypothetical protein